MYSSSRPILLKEDSPYFRYNYVSKREPNWNVENDIVSIHYPLDYSKAIDMIEIVEQFLLNLHENREIGYQE